MTLFVMINPKSGSRRGGGEPHGRGGKRHEYTNELKTKLDLKNSVQTIIYIGEDLKKEPVKEAPKQLAKKITKKVNNNVREHIERQAKLAAERKLLLEQQMIALRKAYSDFVAVVEQMQEEEEALIFLLLLE